MIPNSGRLLVIMVIINGVVSTNINAMISIEEMFLELSLFEIPPICFSTEENRPIRFAEFNRFKTICQIYCQNGVVFFRAKVEEIIETSETIEKRESIEKINFEIEDNLLEYKDTRWDKDKRVELVDDVDPNAILIENPSTLAHLGFDYFKRLEDRLNAIAPLFEEFCGSRKSTTYHRLRLMTEMVVQTSVFRCSIDKVCFDEEDAEISNPDIKELTLLVYNRALRKYQSVYVDRYEADAPVLQVFQTEPELQALIISGIVQHNNHPNHVDEKVLETSLEKAKIPVEEFKEDLSELWQKMEENPSSFASLRILMRAKVRFGVKTILKIEETRQKVKTETGNSGDSGSLNHWTLVEVRGEHIVCTPLYFASAFFFDKNKNLVSQLDKRIYTLGFKPQPPTLFGHYIDKNIDYFAQYEDFGKIGGFLGKYVEEIRQKLVSLGNARDVVPINIVYHEGGVYGKNRKPNKDGRKFVLTVTFSPETSTFGLKNIRVLRLKVTDEGEVQAEAKNYGFVVYLTLDVKPHFVSEDGYMRDVVAVKLKSYDEIKLSQERYTKEPLDIDEFWTIEILHC